MKEVLRKYFGFEQFRDGQEQVIQSLLDGRPTLAVFPTGGGKSLCYQLPALMLNGLTLVISPLIALMKDQVESLERRGIAAARIDSTLTPEEGRSLYQRVAAGEIRLLYIAPERLGNEAFRKWVREMNVAMVAIDEAHCISEWGHNFRPDYLKVARFCRDAGISRVLALTATATPKVAADVRESFGIDENDHVQLGFHRPNLDLRVTPCTASERKGILLDRVIVIDGPAVVYVTRQETAEEVATYLKRHGVDAAAYHAGLPSDFRSETQQRFMAGEIRVIVATIAFGMGIDKSDIRGVIHYNLPKCLENYSQEIGRAGRDGQPAVCEMLACGDDLTTLENFIYSDTPTPQALKNVLGRILRLGERFDVSLYDLSISCDIRQPVITTVLAYLECDEIIEATGRFYSTYQVKLMRERAQVLAGRAREERMLLQRLLDSGQAGRVWTMIDPQASADGLGVPRGRVVKMLRELELAGDAVLQVRGVRQAFRLRNDPGDPSALAARYVGLFQQRENADLARLRQVLEIPAQAGCLTAYLLRYFGEEMKDACGHCDRCRGALPTKVECPPAREPSDEEWQVVKDLAAEKHAALGNSRQLARFLCGMSSPASTRARLSRHEAFGLFADVPFADVFALAGAVSEKV